MFGSRLILSAAAFVLGGMVMLTMISWDMIDPVYPYRLDRIETLLYFAVAGLPGIFWLSVFCRDREARRHYR